MGRIWPYAWAFAIMCIIYTVCKILGLEWAAERAWLEVLLFDVVAVGIITSAETKFIFPSIKFFERGPGETFFQKSFPRET